MKRLLQIVAASFLMLNLACEGPEGPAGPQGETGPAGQQGPAGEDAQTAFVIQYPFDFELDEESSMYFSAASLEGIGISNADVILAFALTGGYLDQNDEEVAFWAPLPFTLNLEEGPLSYTYDASHLSIYFYIETDINLDDMEEERRNALIQRRFFRVVVVPGEILEGNQRKSGSSSEYLKSMSYKEVMKKFNLSEKDVKKIQI